MDKARILLTKVAPPRVKPNILRRSGLVRKLRYMLLNPFSLLHAGPGYGKTTLVATFLADEKIRACWYTIEAKDSDLLVFLMHIVESVRREHPDFGKGLQQAIAEMKEVVTPDDVELLVYQFVNELLGLPGELILVLDDYHRVEKAFFIDQWMQLVVRHLPPNTRIVVISRHQPLWPWLSLMRAHGDFAELGPDDLALTVEETEALFLDWFGRRLLAEQIENIHASTEGWVMPLRIAGEQLLHEGQMKWDEWYRFLDAEVLQQQEIPLQRFLTYTSATESFSEELCVYLLGNGADTFLAEALRRNLFIQPVGDGVYRYHNLFRQLLMSRLSREPSSLEAVNRAVAAYYEQRGEEEQAIQHLWLINDWTRIGQLLAQAGAKLLKRGNLDVLYQSLVTLPEQVKDEYYQLWYYQGEVERFRCLYPQALASYAHFTRIAEERGDVVGQCMGLEGKARVHLDSVQGLKAEELLKRAIGLLDSSFHELAARLYRLLAEIYTNRGNAVEAENWYRRSQELERQTEVELESRLYFRTGRLQSALHLLEKKWREEKDQRMSYLTRSYRETSLLLAFVYGLNGDTEKGIAIADTAIQLGKTAHSPFVEACGYVRKAHLAMLNQEYTAEQIRHLYVKGLHMMEELQSTRGKAETLLGLALLHGREKALDLALAYAQRGLQETEAIKDDWLNGMVRLSIGMAYAHSSMYHLAEPVFQGCVERFRECGDSFGMALSYLWLSFLAYKQENWERFVPAVTQALRFIQSGEYGFLLQRPTMFTPNDVQKLMPILIEAQERQVCPEYISQLLTELGLNNVSFHPGYTLRIQTLGQFRVWLGEQELSEKAWQRGKAKQLFQLLLTKRQHLLAREEIFHYIWEDSDEEAASRDFKVALNALNKALEPNREARASAFFIQRHGSSYGFNLASGCQIDADEFERLVSCGLNERDIRQAVVYLEKGLAYYHGEYLPDCRYEDWCIEERERLQALYLRGAEKLAQSYTALQRYDDCIRWCETILKTDDCWEEAYRLLMYAYYCKNNRAQSVKWYEKCVAKLREQLGVEPLPSTRDTYALIMESRQERR